VCGLIATPVVTVLAVSVVLIPFGMEACEYSRDVGPRDLGMSLDDAGAITARVPICYGGGARVVKLLGPEDAVLWQAEAEESHDLEGFVVGVAPEGFTDAVPYVGPLDPQATYEVQLLPEANDSDTGTGELSTGAHTRFRRSDLSPDQVYFRARTTTADEFDDAACAARGG
jgi:hypothetical protein